MIFAAVKAFFGGAKFRALAILAILSACFFAGWKVHGWKNAQEHADALSSVLKIERELNGRIPALIDKFGLEIQNERAKQELLVGDARAGTLRLRGDLESCRAAFFGPPAAGIGGVPQATRGAPVGDDEARGDLQPPIAEALIRLAGEADEVVHQLSACQGFLALTEGRGYPPE